ncbi:T-cell-interacting, activating receptor on myeloid cells protein 1-like isoform X1 [Gallus gallus]|uniref:T-cell-interacting, activating receptor on myeloid cells protein 1-like isoform X1 n=1 Tax=Gallus gallus TaxID=9031 RepID=UPI001AEA12B9|nr:T-cell-interacting, activating receptor on myeloid cells protein 1-like isoform X1 [Gallus gallus]
MSALILPSAPALQLLKMDHDCFPPCISLSYVPSLLLSNFSPFFSSLFLIFLPVIFYSSPAAAMNHDSPGLRACGAPQQTQCAECISPLVAPQGAPQCNHPCVLICPHQEVTSYLPEKGELTAALRPLPFPSAVSLSQAAPALWHHWRRPSFSVSDHGDVVPRGLVAQCETRTVSLAGWWLVAASRAQQVPRPSLSLRPSQGVSLGDPVTLRCHLPHMAAWVWLYHEEGRSYNKGKKKEQDAAAFFFVSTLQEHAGRYWCQYRVSESAELSVESDPVELVLTDLRYPPCRISLHPEQHVGTGTNVTISCWNKDYGATFLLHKDGSSDPIQRQESSGGGTATFTLFGVTPADSGIYRCSYRPWHYAFMSSPLGDSVMLEVTPTPAPPGAELVSRGNLVVAVVRGCAAVLIFGLGVFFVIDARSLWIRTDESLGGEGI